MNVGKLLVQDNPPTHEEWQALNQGVRNWTLYALVDRDAITVQLIQRRPYTAVQLAFEAGVGTGEDTCLGDGFSKVCHPDVYNAATGVRIARVRAIRMIVKRLLDDQSADGCDLGLTKAYVVLVAKWDHYRDTVKDILSVVAALEEQETRETVTFEDVAAEPGDAEVGVDPAVEGEDESIGTMLVTTKPTFVQMRE